MGPFFLCSLFAIAAANPIVVSSVEELSSAVRAAVAGSVIVVRNGFYTVDNPIHVNCNGSSEQPILIKAETIGGVEINGRAGFNLEGAFVTVQGFNFTHAKSIAISNRVRFTRNVVELKIAEGPYLTVDGDDVEIDRNEFRNKSTVGQMIDVTGTNGQVARNLWVHYNYFHDFHNVHKNGGETIRLGLSFLSRSTGNGTVEFNLFQRCMGENEIISSKSCGNKYRYNTFIDSPGGQL